jgi:hypothetical protein
MHYPSVNTKIIRQAILWIFLIIGIYVLLQLAPILSKPAYLPVDDYFHLWAAGNLNLHSKNPFDAQMVEQLRILEGGNPSNAKISVMLNPPWFVALMMPFGLLKYSTSRLIWLVLSIVILLFAAIILCKIYSKNQMPRWIAILAIFIFAPTISMLEKGQVAFLVILGITGFLYFSDYHRNDWLAGISLSIATIKPQIIILLWIALLLWILNKKRWVILLSFGSSLLALTLIGIIFNHNLIIEYLGMLTTYKMSEWATPTIGSYLRFFWLGVDTFWIQYLPALLGGSWMVYYWIKHRAAWNWADDLPLILLVSLLVSPYSWTYDLVVIIPAIILAAYWLWRGRNQWISIFFSVTFLVISILDMILHREFDEFWFIWLTPAFFVLFLLIRKRYYKFAEGMNIAHQNAG